MEGEEKGHNAPCTQMRGRDGARGSVQSGDESDSTGLFLVPEICCYIFLALINVTGTRHPQVRKGLRMSFRPGGVSPLVQVPSGSEGSGLRHKHGRRVFRSLALPSPGASVHLLAPARGVWPLAKGEL